MIDELKNKLISLGMDATMADKAIQTVAEFAKSKLPSSLHESVDKAMAGEMPDLSQFGSLLGSVKGFFQK